MMRTYGEPNMVMLRPLISRQRGDMFVLNALKVSYSLTTVHLKYTVQCF